MWFPQFLLKVPKQYIVTGLCFISALNLGLLRTNLSIAIVHMTSNTTHAIGNGTELVPSEFNWTSMEKGLVLSAASFGSMFTFFGGFVLRYIGGATTVGVSTLLMAILSLLTPCLLQIHIYIFLIGKIIQGLIEGIATAGIVDTYSHWVLPEERTHLISYYYVGYYAGVALNYPVAGYIAHWFGWRSVFYFTGTIALIWCGIWLIYVHNDPIEDKQLSENEKNQLKTSNPHITHEKIIIPWRSILTSTPVYAYFNECFCQFFGSSFMIYYSALYVKDMFDINVGEVGIITSLPMVCSLITLPIASYFADYLRTNHLSVPRVHKMYLLWGNLACVSLLAVITFWNNFIGSIVCFCLMRIFFSFPDSSYAVICLDMAGQYAGVLKSIGLSFMYLASFLNSLILGFVVQNHKQSEWNLYFMIWSGVSMYGVVSFMLFGSADLQEWAIPRKKTNTQVIHNTEKPKENSI